MAEDPTKGLPTDLAAALRDQSIIVPQDAAVFELVAAWAKAPSPTAAYAPPPATSPAVGFEALCQSSTPSSTTGIGC
jgi:hypothetical protein